MVFILGPIYRNLGDVLVLHTPIIKYIFEIYLGIICNVGGKNGKENMEGLKTVQLGTVVLTMINNLPVKGLILLDFLVFIAEQQNSSKFQAFQYFSISKVFQIIFGALMQHQDATPSGFYIP